MKKTLLSLSLILIVVLALTGCYEWPDPIWNPDDTGLPTPTITGVDVTSLLGGIEDITITGSGFGDVAEEVLVYFKKGTTVGRGRTLSATDTELLVEVPATYSDSLEIWIDRRGCYEYAKYSTNLITINRGQVKFPIVATSVLNKVAINENGDALVSLGLNRNMVSVTVDDSMSTVVDAIFSPSQNVQALRSKGNDYYYTLSYYVAKNGDRFKINSDRNTCVDFAFANNGKVYFVATNNIYSMDNDLTNAGSAVVDTTYNYTVCEVYDGMLYVAATYVGGHEDRANEKLILGYPINADGTLDTVETVVVNWTDDFAGSVISGIVFDAEDRMYVATRTRTPIYVIEPVAGDYANGNISLLYPVLMKEEILSMRWDAGEYMAYLSQNSDGVRSAYRLKMLETASPSYMP